jgi:hypothetical protein
VTVKTGAYTLNNTTDVGNLFTTTGAGAEVPFTLPTAAADLHYGFYVQNSNGLKITAAAGDTIRLVDQVSKAAGYVSSTTVGGFVWLYCINDTEWVGEPPSGSWTVETS